MSSSPTVAALVLCAWSLTAAELPRPTLSVDFDGPIRLNDRALPFSVPTELSVPGKFGGGYHCIRDTKNLFSDEVASLQTKVTNGVYECRGISVAPETRWRTWFRDAYVASAWVKGKRGIELAVEVSGVSGDDDERIAEKWTAIVRQRDRKATDARIAPDDPHPQTVKLTGGWQRVAAWMFADARRGHRRRYALRLATADGSAFDLKGLQFEMQPKPNPEGDQVAPGATLASGQRVAMPPFVVDLPKLGVDFPYTNGTFSAWVKIPESSNLEPLLGPIMCWDRCELGPKVFRPVRGAAELKSPIDLANADWQHLALTWTATNVVAYRNGRETGRTRRRLSRNEPLPVSTLRLGCSNWAGRIPSGFIIDDLALYRQSLSVREVECLAQGKTAADIRREWLAEKPAALLFNRNERAARLGVIVYAPTAVKADFSLTVGKEPPVEFSQPLKAGANVVMAKFDARVFEPGKYRFTLWGAESMTAMKRSPSLSVAGDLEILPRFDREAYRIFNWGGNHPIPLAYAVAAGMNMEHVHANSLERMDAATRLGLHLAVNVSQLNDIFDNGFNREATAVRLVRTLVRHAGRANWDATMTTSEQANIHNWKRAKDFPRWREWANQSGVDPLSGSTAAAFQLSRPRGWQPPADGVLPDDDAALKTLLWVRHTGDPVLQYNKLAAMVAHRLSPGNLVWAEPSCPYGVDLTAYWSYDYSTRLTVSRMKRSYEEAKTAGTSYMPTLGMGYGDGMEGYFEGEAPKEPSLKAKRGFGLTQSLDELKIKTLLCLGVTRASAMSYFDLCAWSEGEKQQTPTPGKLYAEPESGRRFGEAIRRDLLPAMMLLKDLDTDVGTSVAVFLPASSDHTARLGWMLRGYLFDINAEIFHHFPECAVLGDEASAEALARYHHVFFPGAASILAANDRKLMAAMRKGTQLYVDHLCKRDYPKAIRFDDRHPIRQLLEEIRASERMNVPCYLEQTTGEVMLFPRRSALGANVCLVVNDTRGTGPLNQYNHSSDYRPHGAPAKATVSLKLPADWVVYDFFTSKLVPSVAKLANGVQTKGESVNPPTRTFFELNLPAAGGALLIAYPKPLQTLTAKVEHGSDPLEGVLAVSLRDADGQRPLGRQLVKLELKDEKGGRDESGLYLLVDGEARIPLYFGRGKTAALSGRLVERTSGLSCNF